MGLDKSLRILNAFTRGRAAETDLDVAVDAYTGDLLDGLHQQLGPTDGEGGVDLVVTMAGNGHVAVTGQGDYCGFA